MSPGRHLIGVASLALLGLSVLGLVNNDPPAPRAPAAPGTVDIAGFAFGPETLTIAPGTTVTWTNADDTAHTVTSKTGSDVTSGSIPGGGTFEQTYSMPGTYEYFCAFHPFMEGTVEVTAP